MCTEQGWRVTCVGNVTWRWAGRQRGLLGRSSQNAHRKCSLLCKFWKTRTQVMWSVGRTGPRALPASCNPHTESTDFFLMGTVVRAMWVCSMESTVKYKSVWTHLLSSVKAYHRSCYCCVMQLRDTRYKLLNFEKELVQLLEGKQWGGCHNLRRATI